MTTLAAALPKARRRKPLPPGFKIALWQVLYAHAWLVNGLLLWFLSGPHAVIGLVSAASWMALAWTRPWGMGHVWWNVQGCVYHLRRYWRQWRDD